VGQSNESLNIVLAVHHFPPSFKGGAEWRAHRTAKWLQSQGHTVKIVCIESINDTSTSTLRWVDETYDRLTVRRLFMNLSNAPDLVRWEYDNPWIENHLAAYLTGEKPDIFHLISGYLMSGGAIRAAKRLNIPVALTLTDFWFICPRLTLQRATGQVCVENSPLDCVRCNHEEQRRFRLPATLFPDLMRLAWQGARFLPAIARHSQQIEERAKMLKVALNQTDVVICPSNFIRQTYIRRGFRAPWMQFLRQGVVHIPTSPPQKSPSTRLRIGYIGQIAWHKGIHLLIEAFKNSDRLVAQAQLRLFGDINQFPEYYQKLQALFDNGIGRQIEFLGVFRNRDIAQILEEIDVLVVPSVWYENSPNVILEAFAHQTPVIASDLGGMAELVTDQINGFLFRPNDAGDLAHKLETLVDDRRQLIDLQKNMPAPITIDDEMAELSEIYQSILPLTSAED
jgi:glycosyltransferase involved in cell wall biosynthesis